MLKDIKHLALLQEWKLKLDAAAYENNNDANMSKPSNKKEIGLHYSDLYWSATIKDTIQRFPFLTIMEHTANILKLKQGLISLLLKVFAMFLLRLIGVKDKVEAIYIRCFNCKKEIGLYLATSTLEEMINNFLLNAILHHVGMLWIICSNKELKY